MDHPLRPIVAAWLKKIELAMEYKKRHFGDDAEESMRYFDGYDGFYDRANLGKCKGFSWSGAVDQEPPTVTFGVQLNKVAELVSLYGPVLYHKNPVRQVNPRKFPKLPPSIFGPPNDPMAQMAFAQMDQQVEMLRAPDQARAVLLEEYLNYTPTALDLKTESRRMIDETLIKGAGCLWTEVYEPPGGGGKLVGSFYDTIDNLVVDPDLESIADAQWVARRCVHPVWEVEQMYGLAPGSLKATQESFNAQAETLIDDNGDYRRKQGQTNDLMVYWKVWSKMGLGGRLSGVMPGMRAELDAFGDHCYLVVCDQCPYPLNLPPEATAQAMDEELFERVQWPTPFWADDSWPFTLLGFRWKPRSVWPSSLIKPAWGLLAFMNWVCSFVASKVRVSCRDFIACAKSASEEIKETLTSGSDWTMIEIEKQMGPIDQVVQFLQHPTFNGDILKVYDLMHQLFREATGLTELAYGQTAVQLRSASEAQVKADQLRVRPDDMANRVEDAMGDVARKEALAARWHLTGQDVAPVLGPYAAQWWDMYVTPTDPAALLHQLEYRIEAGSTKKPNREREAANMQAAMQTLFAPLQQYAMMTGDVMPLNRLISDWAKSMDLDPKGYLMQPPPPPMPMPGQPGANGAPVNGKPQMAGAA